MAYLRTRMKIYNYKYLNILNTLVSIYRFENTAFQCRDTKEESINIVIENVNPEDSI